MYQAVDTSGQTNKDTKVGDGLDGARYLVTTLGCSSKFLPRIDLALLHAQADAAFVFVDFKHHDFNFVAQRHDFAGSRVFVGPIHFGDVYQAFNAWLKLNKCTVISDVGNFTEHACLCGVAACNAHPGVVAHLLQAQRYAVFLAIELEHFGCEFLTSLHHFAGVAYTAPCHVGDVQQAIDAAQIHKCAVFGDVFNHTINDRAFFEGFEQFGAFFAHAGFHYSAA